MKSEDLAFANQQLAGMLRSGIPLEGALRQLCSDLQRGPLQEELLRLRDDLAQGVPLGEALGHRRLPEFYARMVRLGAAGGDLPTVLTLLADYYQRVALVWTRLQGLLVYPVLVLTGSLILAIFIACIVGRLDSETSPGLTELFGLASGPSAGLLLLRGWLPVLVLAFVLAAVLTAATLPRWRERLRWRLPGFRESALANLADSVHLLLARGCPLDDALALAEQLESGSPAATELGEWRRRLAAGQGKPQQFVASGRVFPPLFRWLVAQGGENLATGFQRASEVYHARALHRIDVLLYLALPASIVMIGVLLITQFYPFVHLVVLQLNYLGDLGGS